MSKRIACLVIAAALTVPQVAAAHGHGHVMGTIRIVESDRLEVLTKEGKSVSIPLTKSTKYFRGKSRATSSALKVGSRVVVHLAADGSAVEIRLPSVAAGRLR